MSDVFTLEGKRILITGASSGIGAAIADLAAQLGASLILVARREDKLAQVQAGLVNSATHQIVAGDITSADFIQALVQKAGKLDGLVHAAGVAPAMPIGMIDDAHVESVLKTNYTSFLELMKFYSKRKFRNNGFSVVEVSSVSAMVGWAGGCVYSGSKGALSASVRALAMELAPKGVRVNAVCPSNIRTPMYETTAASLNDEVALTELLRQQPLGLGEPRQVAWPVCFLLSDVANFITGVNLPVDGGFLAH